MPPTPEHEALHRIFQHDESLFPRAVARVFNVSTPEPVKVSVLNTDLTVMEPLERRADSIFQVDFMVENSAGKYILVVESQTDRDETRRRRWPLYIAYLQDKYACPVVFVVVCSKKATAEWARQVIEIGLPDLICMTVRLVVFGPDNVPAITDPSEAALDVTLTMFSALTHSRSPQVHGILEALATALNTIAPETATLLAEFTEAGLGTTVGQQIWRALMATQTFPYVSQLRAEGRAEGRAADILRILERRGVEVDVASRERITGCTDLETLGTWLDHSLTATAVTDLFG